jgi:hypothetical protein
VPCRLFCVFVFVCLLSSTKANADACITKQDEGSQCYVNCPGQAVVCAKGDERSGPNCQCTGGLSGENRTTVQGLLLLQNDNRDVLETDVIPEVNKRLALLRDYHLRNNCRNIEHHFCRPQNGPDGPHNVCNTWYESVCDVKVMGKLTAVSPLTVEVQPIATVDQPDWDHIPRAIMGMRGTYENCDPGKQSWTFHHSERTMVGERITHTKVVKTGVSSRTKVSFDFILKGDETIGFDDSVSITDSQEENKQKEETVTVDLPYNVSPMYLQVVTHEWMKMIVPVSYHGTIQVDAPISSNLEKVKLLSELFPDVKDRTFEFSGVVSAARLWENTVHVHSTKLTAKQCETPPEKPLKYEPYVR